MESGVQIVAVRNGVPAVQSYRLAKWGAYLATRERGQEVREEIEAWIAKMQPDELIVIDFADVEAITISFGDECLARLMVSLAAGDFAARGLLVRGAAPDVRETLEVVLARRKLAALLRTDRGYELLGSDEGWLGDTLRAAVKLKTFSAAELAEELGLTPQAANNRLKRLVATGAVQRQRTVPEGGGKEFVYRVMVPEYA